nr:hypothetical protein [Tanacetum cinerariifolium]
GEALLTTCYILNRVPSKRSIKIPYELWNQRTPKLDYLQIWGCRAIVRLPESKKRKLRDKGIECIFLSYARNRKAYRFIVVEPNDIISINTIIESVDARFDKNRFKTIPKAHEFFKETVSTEIPITTEGNNDDSILDHQQVEPIRSTRQRRQRSFSLDFEMYLVERDRKGLVREYPIIYNLDEDPQTYSETLVELPLDQKPSRVWIFKRKLRVDGSIEKFKARTSAQNFNIKDLGEAEVILGIKILRKENRLMLTQSHYIEKILKRFDSFDCLPVSTPFEVGSKLTYNTGRILAQNKYAKVIGSLMYAMTCTRHDIAYAVGRLSRHTSSPSKEHWDALNRVFKYLKKTMDYGSEYSRDPSALEAEFVALVSCCKEAEWPRDLLINIPLWTKPMPPISVHCDSQSTLSRAYNQVYNGGNSSVTGNTIVRKNGEGEIDLRTERTCLEVISSSTIHHHKERDIEGALDY